MNAVSVSGGRLTKSAPWLVNLTGSGLCTGRKKQGSRYTPGYLWLHAVPSGDKRQRRLDCSVARDHRASMNRRLLTHLAAAMALLWASTAGASLARAQSSTSVQATMAVSVEVLPNCTVAAEPLAFGGVTAGATPAAGATASIEVACGPDVTFAVSLDNGQNPDNGTRRALDPATGQYLAYDIFADAAHTRRWGGVGAQNVAGVTSPTGTARLTAYGLIGSETQVAAGRYGDLVTVTTDF